MPIQAVDLWPTLNCTGCNLLIEEREVFMMLMPRDYRLIGYSTHTVASLVRAHYTPTWVSNGVM